MLRSLLLALVASLVLAAPLAAQPVEPANADARLKALYETEWAWRAAELALDPTGGREGTAHLPRVDAASQQRRLAYWTEILRRLDAIPFDQLSPRERINAEVLRTSIGTFVEQLRYREYEDPFNFWVALTPRLGFDSVAAYRNYVGRLREMPRYVDEQIANMRAGMARGFIRPRVSLAGRDRPIEPLGSADLARNPLFVPFAEIPSSIAEADRAALVAEGRAAVAAAAPAFARLHAFVRDEYIPNGRATIAAADLPDGSAFYAARVRQYTTTDLTPDEIHAIGLREVARIDADMQATMRASGWTGDFPGFLQFLRTDPQFYARTPYELIARATYVANRVNGQLKYFFGVLPRYRFTIIPTPANIAPFWTGGNGGLDSCLINTYDLPSRPLYTIPPLTVHECAPGHSFQAALALEGPDRPAFRKATYFSGYGEGWALYLEWLGTRMGIYETPYDEFGRQTYEMWRASRLVIDTGIHQMGWSRQQAIDFLRSRTALSDHEITTEIDRYINDPGQALAYKLGELLIRRERAEAEAALGTRFDQRRFHDTILGLGPVPLSTLERVLDGWVASGGQDSGEAQ